MYRMSILRSALRDTLLRCPLSTFYLTASLALHHREHLRINRLDNRELPDLLQPPSFYIWLLVAVLILDSLYTGD